MSHTIETLQSSIDAQKAKIERLDAKAKKVAASIETSKKIIADLTSQQDALKKKKP